MKLKDFIMGNDRVRARRDDLAGKEE